VLAAGFTAGALLVLAAGDAIAAGDAPAAGDGLAIAAGEGLAIAAGEEAAAGEGLVCAAGLVAALVVGVVPVFAAGVLVAGVLPDWLHALSRKVAPPARASVLKRRRVNRIRVLSSMLVCRSSSSLLRKSRYSAWAHPLIAPLSVPDST
jgi:hypothetical protein